jgi:hypothetical protein
LLTPIILKTVIAAAVLGILAAHALFLGWWTLVPWGIAGVALGYKFSEKFVITGIVYGFVLVLVFLIGQYTGDRPLIGRLPFFAALAIFGSFCGLILTTVGGVTQRYFAHAERG